MSAPPEFTSREAIEDFIIASRRATKIAPIELRNLAPGLATEWLRQRWDLYYVPEHQEAILAEFMAIRLSK